MGALQTMVLATPISHWFLPRQTDQSTGQLGDRKPKCPILNACLLQENQVKATRSWLGLASCYVCEQLLVKASVSIEYKLGPTSAY